ncbi:MAG: signal peptidase I [Candidatus Latescibacteria bacterium]|jgi:signal peptidase I|nr:signal peptidase I [Candidatus Latescibacterota bacterium]
MKKRFRGIAKEAISLSILALVLFAGRSSLADHYEVPTGSMEYTLVPGDRIVVDKRAYGMRIPFTNWKLTDAPVTRGEVVIFDSPVEDVRLVKRVVAVAGDTVAIRGGRVSINGEYLYGRQDAAMEVFGERTVHLNLKHGGGPHLDPTLVPPGLVLTIGDARGNSRDGRIFGMIDEDAIYGRALAVYYRSADGFVWLDL